MFTGVFILLLLGLLLGGLITGIVLWSTSSRAGSSSEMSCGACGYAVRGLTQLNCPECGADLREAGIGRTGSPGRRVTGIALTIGCSFILLMGCGLSMFVFLSAGSPTTYQPATQSLPAPVQKSPSNSSSPDSTDQTDGEADASSSEPAP